MNSLNEIFNISSNAELITKSGDVVVPHDTELDSNIDYDYERTRSNLHSLLSQGQDALIHALEVAKQSEHPRAFEVVGNLVKQLADINHQLLDLSEKRQKLFDKNKREEPKTVTNNSIFVGSTHELNKLLNNLNKGDI
jgi:hypothetical protein